MERIDGEEWSFIVDADCFKDADGEWSFYHVDPYENGLHLCQTFLRANQEVRSQLVELDEGRRPGHVLWRERAMSRIKRLSDGEMIPWRLVKR